MSDLKPLGDYSSIYDSKVLLQPLANGTGGNSSVYESMKGGSKKKRFSKKSNQ